MAPDVRIICLSMLLGVSAAGQATNTPPDTNVLAKSRSIGDADLSDFLDKKYGFLPMAMPITEPAVGFGGAVGLAFISRPTGQDQPEYVRPNITFVGGMGTENGSWGAVAGDLRNWFDDRVQSVAGVFYGSVNLDFHGIGDDPVLADNPLRYNLQPVGGMLQGKYRLGDSRVWAGISYAFVTTQVDFDALAGTPGLPDLRSESNVGGLTPSLTWDTRDNIFTPTRGTYIEATVGFFSQALGSDDEFQRAQIIGMHYLPLGAKFFLGLRGQVAATFGAEPFYLRPFISLRGVPAMRYQGEELAQIEAELRWQFFGRFSLVGFGGGGAVWNDFARVENVTPAATGGVGFRYELARKHGIHVGLDVAFGPDNTAVYVQFGSAWMRP